MEGKKYYVYHIKGKKIGCTTNLQKRVELEQGYKKGEYEILLTTDNAREASEAERILQQDLGYPVDQHTYEELTQKLVPTDRVIKTKAATTTFKIAKEELDSSYLMGLTLENEFGTFEISSLEQIEWILQNARTSRFKQNNCFIYNKALSEAFSQEDEETPTIEQFELVRDWAQAKGIYSKGDTKTQMLKLVEEVGETCKAILNSDEDEIIDGLGDSLVVLINLSHLAGYKLEDCLESAYQVIAKRKGKMVNGTFVKDGNSPEAFLDVNGEALLDVNGNVLTGIYIKPKKNK